MALALMNGLRHFANVTTLHGIKDLFNTDSKAIRIIWAILLVATTGVMIYETERIVVAYIDQPIATNIHHQRMTRANLAKKITPFICVYDWMSKSRAEANYTKAEIMALDTFSNAQTARAVRNPKLAFLNATERLEVLQQIRRFQDEMLHYDRTLEYYYKPIMKQFTFLPSIDDERYSVRYIISIDTVCFPIDLDAAADVVGVPIYRKDLDLQAWDTIEYLKAIHRPEVTFSFYQGANARYFSEIDRVISNFSVDSEPTQLNLRMRLKQLVHLSRRTMPCKDYPNEEAKSKYPVNYARQLCMQKCMDRDIYVPKYNCTFMVPKTEAQRNFTYITHTKGYRLCTAEKFFLNANFSPEELVRIHKCQDSCEDLIAYCTEWDIHNERVRWVPPRSCKDTGCLNLAIVSQPTVEVSEEVLLMTFDTLLSNIGGQAGLWFGGSILSVVQLIFFCFLYGSCKCAKHRVAIPAFKKRNSKLDATDTNQNLKDAGATPTHTLLEPENDIPDADEEECAAAANVVANPMANSSIKNFIRNIP